MLGIRQDNLISKKSNEIEIWNALRQGDKAALDYIYKNQVRSLFEYGMKISSNKVLVEDCIHDLFLDLWNKRGKLKQIDGVKFYLFTAIKRRLIRKMEREGKSFFVNFQTQSIPFEIEFSSESKIIAHELDQEKVGRLNKALTKLTPRQKEAVFLKYYQQFTYQQIAKILEIEVKASYKLVARAIEVLKASFYSLMAFFSL